MWSRWIRRIAAVSWEIHSTFAYLRDSTTTMIRQSWTTASAWALDVTSDARIFRVNGRWELASAALTLALVALLLGPYLLFRAIARHMLAYQRHPDLAALWYGLLAYELCWVILSVVTLIWQSKVISLDVAVGLFATLVWVSWSNGVLTYYDAMLHLERTSKMIVGGVLREAWWSNL